MNTAHMLIARELLAGLLSLPGDCAVQPTSSHGCVEITITHASIPDGVTHVSAHYVREDGKTRFLEFVPISGLTTGGSDGEAAR